MLASDINNNILYEIIHDKNHTIFEPSSHFELLSNKA